MIKIVKNKISFYDLCLIFVKKIKIVIASAFVGLFLGVFSTNFLVTPKYSATGTFIIDKVINVPTIRETASDIVTISIVLDTAVESLNNKGINVIDGISFNGNTIKKGLTVSYDNNSPSIAVTYTSATGEYNGDIVNAVIQSAVEYGNEHFSIFVNNLIVGELAGNSTFIGLPNHLVYFITVSVSLISMLSIIYLRIATDGIIHYVGVCSNVNFYQNVMEVCTRKAKNIFSSIQIATLQQKIESTNLPSIKLYAFIPSSSDIYTDELISQMVQTNRQEGLRVLVADFDWEKELLVDTLTTKLNLDKANAICANSQPYQLTKIIDNISYFSLCKSKHPVRCFKEINIPELFQQYKLNYDCIFVKMSPASYDGSYILLKDVADIFVVNVTLGSTKIEKLEDILNTLKRSNVGNVHLNFFNTYGSKINRLIERD